MDEPQPHDPPENAPQAEGPTPVGDTGQFTQRVRHQQVSARVPDSVAAGVYASGSLVLTGPHEFIIDFLQTVTRPHRVAARIILPPTIMASVVRALKQNLDNYSARFGPPQDLPKPPPGLKPPSVEEVYEQLKLDDDTAAGTYANTVMITHSMTEFCLDFITGFYPRSTVAQRIYMSATQLPRLLETLTRSFEQYQQKVREAQQKQIRPPGPEFGPGGETRLC